MIEAMKQALEALETEVSIDWTNNDEFNASAEKMHDAITSLRQAIAKLESQDDSYCQACDGALCTAKKGCVALSNPPQRTWQGLTDEEEQELDEKYGDDMNVYIDQRDLKLKEKNT